MILIGFDAMDRRRLAHLMAAGQLPNITRLAGEQGVIPMGPRPDGFHSMPWPSFIRGESVIEHGWYAAKRWDAAAMRLEAKPPAWLAPTAFWDRLVGGGHRIALLDVPFCPHPAPDFKGLCLQGWQNHDQIEHYSRPSDLWADLQARFGDPIMKRELCTSQSLAELARIRADVLAANEQFGRICAYVLGQEKWDLFMAVFGACHRVGHYLWDGSQTSDRQPSPDLASIVEGAVDDVYRDCDRILGELLQQLKPSARVMAFSLHGMRKDNGWCEVLPRLLASIDNIGAPAAEAPGMLYRIKQKIPSRLVERVIWRLPYSISETIVPLWSRSMYDWDTVRCFPLPGGDGNGFVRINLKDRETRGTVIMGQDYHELCDRIAEGLESFRDIRTGEPIVKQVDPVSEYLGDQEILGSRVPDLVVHWNPIPAHETRGVVSDRHGEVLWEPGWQTRSGRSGDHSPRGWVASHTSHADWDSSIASQDIASLGSAIHKCLARSPG